MTLPRAVAAATEELAALEQQFQALNQGETPPVEQTDPPAAPEPPSEPAAPPNVASTDVPPSETEEKWEHKYRRLQGKYDAEVPRLHGQVKELQAALQQLQSQIPPPKPAEPEKPAEPDKYVSDEDVANYGADFVDIQRRIALDATREMRKQLEEMKAQLAKQNSRVDSVSVATFETRLRQAVPDFEEVNADPNWFAWLNEVDPLIRGPRRMVAQAAFEREDVDAVQEYVKLFKQTQQPPAPKHDGRREQELARQVQPPRAGGQSAPVSGPKVYTMGELDALLSKMQVFATQGRFEEAKKLDAEISAAYSEGRITA